VVTVTAPAGGVKSRDVLVGNLIGICTYDAAEGAETELSLTGVWELAKASGQINAGAAV
jgi:predicted RecA/RadA family phage recombinase